MQINPQFQKFNNQKNQDMSSFGNKKIPRFLYHFTTESNYQSMLKNGEIKTAKTGAFQGFYMVDLNNLLKRWNASKDWENLDLREELLRQVRKLGEKVVVIRIPTENIDKNKLLIRSQNKLLPLSRDTYLEALANWKKTGEIPNAKFEHLFIGDKATNSKRYKQRKEAIEYIYPAKLDISMTQKVGSTEVKAKNRLSRKLKYLVKDFMKLVYPTAPNFSVFIERYKPSKIDAKSTFIDLFKGTPEEKALKQFKN